jgi:type VI secretion system FHA domain protein
MTTLKLEIVGPQAAALGAAAAKVFRASGGTIGRLSDNDWVLPDPYISSRHARIHWRNGQFLIEDTSSNGVFINSPDHRLGRGQLHALQGGDRIFIDAYEIRVTPASSAGGSFDAQPSRQCATDPLRIPDDPFGISNAPPAPTPRPRRTIPEDFTFGASTTDRSVAGDSVDPLQLLGFEKKHSTQPVSRAEDLAGRSPLGDHYKPPARVTAPSVIPARESSLPAADGSIPDGYDPLLDDDSSESADLSAAAPPHLPSAQRVVTHAPVGALDFQAMLAGAGLHGVQVTPELAESFGRVLRTVVGGLMDVLRAREQIKSEFRLRMTTFKSTDNNPLKFSANIDDALHNLLVKRNSAYLNTEQAFEDAFADVRNHQMAMLAGVRVAFDAMLEDFEPVRLQETFDRQLKKGTLLSAPARLKYWELYREKFHDRMKDRETNFRELFGDEFARAYEEQLESLKAAAPTPRK